MRGSIRRGDKIGPHVARGLGEEVIEMEQPDEPVPGDDDRQNGCDKESDSGRSLGPGIPVLRASGAPMLTIASRVSQGTTSRATSDTAA